MQPAGGTFRRDSDEFFGDSQSLVPVLLLRVNQPANLQNVRMILRGWSDFSNSAFASVMFPNSYQPAAAER